MAEEVKSQWVVRLPDRLTRLTRPLAAIRIFSTAEVLLYKPYYGTGEWKSIIERQYAANAGQDDSRFEYWVLLFPLDTTTPFEVLCCTVQRVTADRILDSLWSSLFSNCGDNTYVDLRELLAADLVTPETVAATPTAGRFVDLGDGESLRPAATVGNASTVNIPVQIIPTREDTPSIPVVDNATGLGRLPIGQTRGVSHWSRSTGIGGDNVGSSAGYARSAALDAVNYSDTELRATAAMYNDQAQIAELASRAVRTADRADAIQRGTPLELTPPNLAPVSRAELEDIMRQSTVPNIGRGWSGNLAWSQQDRQRFESQLNAAIQRQLPTNRNTISPSGAIYGDYRQPQDVAALSAPPDNDAVDRVDPGF